MSEFVVKNYTGISQRRRSALQSALQIVEAYVGTERSIGDLTIQFENLKKYTDLVEAAMGDDTA